MSLLDASPYKPASKVPLYVIVGIAVAAVIGILVWHYYPRYLAEKRGEVTIRTFIGAIVSGNLEQAYKIYQPSQSYSFKDFTDDWGPNGYYGPIKSFAIESSSIPKNSNVVAVTFLLSPYSPFPKKDDAVAQSKTKTVTLWIVQQTQRISFPPPSM